jgi:hypothetical protein
LEQKSRTDASLAGFEIRPISGEDFAQKYGKVSRRPKNSILENTKKTENLRDWKAAIDEYLGL